ncbi:hypothetical protein BCR36DRAFT_410201 [Piromyces finnis]|uniref:tRNA-splicing endonuclease subunit Sen54 N-terminal domain-containing protein n=1 Tax=Piromyces finnis TaxID=1754191 RepID=A0A1Y1VFQ8_9FUNG|nr:hypothetical protein BCR36DRAFT_410201 [Piromyces finnis]|eukprot:ORX55257.1 hypothetical protein BCR36DRAFT_410201 [Piromyces finnis]
MEDVEEIEQEQADYSLFLNNNLKNISNVSKIIKNKLNDTKSDEDKQENILNSLNNLKKVISESHVVSSRNLSVAKWDYSLNLAIVKVKHGNLFETMGKIINGKLTLFPEETLFLIEKGSLLLVEENDEGEEYPISIQHAYSIIYSIPSFSFEKYRVYSYLKRLGYIIVEHEMNLTTTNIEFKDDKENNLQNNNNINIKIDNMYDKSILKEKITNYINIFSKFMEQFSQSKKQSITPLAQLYKKSLCWLDKLLIVPFSLAFSLETNSKINYLKNQENNTQPLFNYYDDATIENIYSKISIIPYYNTNMNKATNSNTNLKERSLIIDYDIYKPNGQYSKKKKSIPDFYLMVQSCLNDFPHFIDFIEVVNERDNHYNIFTKSNVITNTNKNKKPNMKTEIKLAMVNSANITFADIDNEYIRSIRK